MKETLGFKDHLEHMQALRQAALRAADPAAAVSRNLNCRGKQLTVGERVIGLGGGARVFLIALGKASVAMTQEAAGRLGPVLEAGVAAVPEGSHGPPLPKVEFQPAGHPLPNQGSLLAGRKAFDLLERTGPTDVVVGLISGGGSAMMELPRSGITLRDLQKLNRQLIRSGLPIEAINEVRKSLSLVKAGGLVRQAHPALVVGLILSDVVGDRLSAVASGPTVLRYPDPARARDALRNAGLWEEVPGSIRQALHRNGGERLPARRPINRLIGTNRMVVEAAAAKAQDLGFRSQVISKAMQGEAETAGRRFARKVASSPPGACLLMGGETTVTVHGSGLGGRNQELALAAAMELPEHTACAIMALSTDGVDGPTDAAGALVTHRTSRTAAALNLDLGEALTQNNSYPVLERLDCLIKTGATGTNLNDLVVGIHYP